jgi:PIN domain nuclease of toxin-antitoxin system
MRLLLDTHTLLWALADPARLSPRAAALIRDASTTLLVSAASAWEIATKQRLGKLPGGGPIVAGYAAHLARLRVEELPIRADHALMAGGFMVEHHDRFDRMLAAQAIVEGVPLVTDDPAFARFVDLETVW